MTVPFGVLGVLALTRFREPTVHRSVPRRSVRVQLAETAGALRRPGVPVLVLGTVPGAAALQMILEFGPLWLVASGAPALLFGAFTAAMTATLGSGASRAPCCSAG